MLSDSLRSSLRASPEILPQRIPLDSPDCGYQSSLRQTRHSRPETRESTVPLPRLSVAKTIPSVCSQKSTKPPESSASPPRAHTPLRTPRIITPALFKRVSESRPTRRMFHTISYLERREMNNGARDSRRACERPSLAPSSARWACQETPSDIAEDGAIVRSPFRNW